MTQQKGRQEDSLSQKETIVSREEATEEQLWKESSHHVRLEGQSFFPSEGAREKPDGTFSDAAAAAEASRRANNEGSSCL